MVVIQSSYTSRELRIRRASVIVGRLRRSDGNHGIAASDHACGAYLRCALPHVARSELCEEGDDERESHAWAAGNLQVLNAVRPEAFLLKQEWLSMAWARYILSGNDGDVHPQSIQSGENAADSKPAVPMSAESKRRRCGVAVILQRLSTLVAPRAGKESRSSSTVTETPLSCSSFLAGIWQTCLSDKAARGEP